MTFDFLNETFNVTTVVPDRNHKQNPKPVMQHGDPHYDGLFRCFCLRSCNHQRSTTARVLSLKVGLLCEGSTAAVEPARSTFDLYIDHLSISAPGPINFRMKR